MFAVDAVPERLTLAEQLGARPLKLKTAAAADGSAGTGPVTQARCFPPLRGPCHWHALGSFMLSNRVHVSTGAVRIGILTPSFPQQLACMGSPGLRETLYAPIPKR